MAGIRGRSFAAAAVSAGGLLEVGDGMLVVFLGTIVTVVLGVVFVMTSEYRTALVSYWLKIWTRQPGESLPRPPVRKARPKRRRRGPSGRGDAA